MIKKGGMLPKIVSVILFLLAGMSITMTSHGHGVCESGMCVQNLISLPNHIMSPCSLVEQECKYCETR